MFFLQFGQSFEVGKVYSVPLSFTKSGSSESSMANQYFGSTALVRPQSNGTYDVRFSTNRSDYVESIKYSGSELESTNESGTTREYKMSVPATKSDATYTVSMTITPMKELGGGAVDADLHLAYSRAQSQGSDTGQVAASTRGASASGSDNASSSASGAKGKSSPTTGDVIGAARLACWCAVFAALLLIVVAGASLHRLRARESATRILGSSSKRG